MKFHLLSVIDEAFACLEIVIIIQTKAPVKNRNISRIVMREFVCENYHRIFSPKI